jgi:hypothetical protein
MNAALSCQHLLDGGEGAKDHPVTHAHYATAPILFDHLRIAQFR